MAQKIKYIFCLLVFIFSGLDSLTAQTDQKRWALGIQAGTRQYNGDLGNGWWNFKGNTATGGVQVSRFLSPTFDVGISGNFGQLGFSNNQNDFTATISEASLGFKFKTYNDKILKSNALLAPYLTAGIGAIQASSDKMSGHIFALNIPVGLGLRIRLSESVSLNLQSTANFHSLDTYDGLAGGEGSFFNKNDSYLQHHIGIVLNIGKHISKDDDKDGIPNKTDKCPNTPAGYKVDANGCPVDSDHDGVVDGDDKCPDLAGLPEYNGCPDTDNDGVPDHEDKCPKTKGAKNFNGCPDSDGDGVGDHEDKCPNQAGTLRTHGCPDTDGDGISDMEDKCPKKPGSPLYNGCPDTDGDGIPDHEDNCPNIAGSVEKKGCPAGKDAIRETLSSAAKSIQFQTGSAITTHESLENLDKVVSILKQETNIKLVIEGHTDNEGNAASNKTLSQKRADAVKTYLIKKGIASVRLTAIGYGNERPIADNKTSSGRQKNRRVGFVISY